MANSLLVLGAKLGMDVRIGAPKTLWPFENIVARARAVAEETGGKILLTENAEEAVKCRFYPYRRVGQHGRAERGVAGTH